MISPKAWHTRCARRELAAGVSQPPERRRAGRVPARSSALGLAAGFDLDGRLIEAVDELRFGAVELGSVRLHDPAFVRMCRALRRARRRRASTVRNARRMELGVSLVKRRATPWSEAAAEFEKAIRALAGLADHLTLNPGPQRPPAPDFFAMVERVCEARDALHRGGRPHIALVVKLPTEWTQAVDVRSLASVALRRGLDGLLMSAEGVEAHDHRAMLRDVRAAIPAGARLFSVGGVTAPRELLQRVQDGADLVQVHAVLRRAGRRRWVARAVKLLAARRSDAIRT